MGEAQTLHFYDFGISEPVTKPQNQLFSVFVDTRTPKSNQEEYKNILTCVYKSRIFGNPICRSFPKRRALKKNDDHLIKT